LELLNLRGHRLESAARTAPVAVFGISRLIGSLDWLRPGLGAQEGSEEEGGVRVLTKGFRKAPGGSGGVADVVEVEVALRSSWKTGEGIDGAGGQEPGPAALSSATGVSAGQRKDQSLYIQMFIN
jgi:hypothetical protein